VVTSFKVTSIELTRYPLFNAIGDPFDPAQGYFPDVWIELLQSGTPVYRSDVRDESLASLTFTENMPVTVLATLPYLFKIYDEDGFGSEYMGGLSGNFPELTDAIKTLTLSSSDGKIEFIIHIE